MLQTFIPLLEDFFSSNPYPDAQEREYLARKSKMTTRQIEVWVGFSYYNRLFISYSTLRSFRTIAGVQNRTDARSCENVLDHCPPRRSRQMRMKVTARQMRVLVKNL